MGAFVGRAATGYETLMGDEEEPTWWVTRRVRSASSARTTATQATRLSCRPDNWLCAAFAGTGQHRHLPPCACPRPPGSTASLALVLLPHGGLLGTPDDRRVTQRPRALGEVVDKAQQLVHPSASTSLRNVMPVDSRVSRSESLRD